MKMINKILCALGFHDWRYRNQRLRQCANCKRSEQRVPYDLKNWFKL